MRCDRGKLTGGAGFVRSTGNVLIGSNVHIEPIYDGDEVSRAMMAAVQEAFRDNF